MNHYIKLTCIELLFATLTGCGAGYNKVLFSTRSTIGIDIDTQPPTAEVGISRKEGVLEPVFENGQTLTVQASFSSSSGGFSRFFFGVGSTFSTGEASIAMTELFNAPDAKPQNGHTTYKAGTDPRTITFSDYEGIPLDDETKRKKIFSNDKKDVKLLEKGLVKPVYFGTDTSLGIKVKWTNPNSPSPQGIKVGFDRSELAWAPISIINETDPTTSANYSVNISSLLASLDT